MSTATAGSPSFAVASARSFSAKSWCSRSTSAAVRPYASGGKSSRGTTYPSVSRAPNLSAISAASRAPLCAASDPSTPTRMRFMVKSSVLSVERVRLGATTGRVLR